MVKDKDLQLAVELLVSAGAEKVRDTRTGALWAVGDLRVAVPKRTKDYHGGRNCLSEVRRTLRQAGIMRVLLPGTRSELLLGDAELATDKPISAQVDIRDLPDVPEVEPITQTVEPELPKETDAMAAKKKKAAPAKKKATKKKTTKTPRPKPTPAPEPAPEPAPVAKKKKVKTKRRSYKRRDTTTPTKAQQQAAMALVQRMGGRDAAAAAAGVGLSTLDRVRAGGRPVRNDLLQKVMVAAGYVHTSGDYLEQPDGNGGGNGGTAEQWQSFLDTYQDRVQLAQRRESALQRFEQAFSGAQQPQPLAERIADQLAQRGLNGHDQVQMDRIERMLALTLHMLGVDVSEV